MSNIVPTGKDLSSIALANNIRISSIDDLQRLGELLARSGFFEDCKQAAQAVVKILAGSELGFPGFQVSRGASKGWGSTKLVNASQYHTMF